MGKRTDGCAIKGHNGCRKVVLLETHIRLGGLVQEAENVKEKRGRRSNEIEPKQRGGNIGKMSVKEHLIDEYFHEDNELLTLVLLYVVVEVPTLPHSQ